MHRFPFHPGQSPLPPFLTGVQRALQLPLLTVLQFSFIEIQETSLQMTVFFSFRSTLPDRDLFYLEGLAGSLLHGVDQLFSERRCGEDYLSMILVLPPPIFDPAEISVCYYIANARLPPPPLKEDL